MDRLSGHTLRNSSQSPSVALCCRSWQHFGPLEIFLLLVSKQIRNNEKESTKLKLLEIKRVSCEDENEEKNWILRVVFLGI